jgi:ABC-2 type transport system ATP-binding protein
VELEIPDAMARIPGIESQPYVRECSLHGVVLHVILNEEVDMAALRVFTGVEPKPITPSLEDVFIALSRKSREKVTG